MFLVLHVNFGHEYVRLTKVKINFFLGQLYPRVIYVSCLQPMSRIKIFTMVEVNINSRGALWRIQNREPKVSIL
jgi:hypothetical protein